MDDGHFDAAGHSVGVANGAADTEISLGQCVDPARDKGNRFIFNKGFNEGAFSEVDPVILNLGVGYPF